MVEDGCLAPCALRLSPRASKRLKNGYIKEGIMELTKMGDPP
jgi:hypothetical protein